ncbi:MAG: hypothetical protein JF611_10310 [Betaproteobacteria bacterium]|nr:hypothetical protein [Betaproteobacteria bacterium]
MRPSRDTSGFSSSLPYSEPGRPRFFARLFMRLKARLPAEGYYGVALGVEAAWPTPLPVSAKGKPRY